MKGRISACSKEIVFEIFKRRESKKGQVKEWIIGKYPKVHRSTILRIIEAFDIVKNNTLNEISEKYSKANSKVYFNYAMEYCNKKFDQEDSMLIKTSDKKISLDNLSVDEITCLYGYKELYIQSEGNLKIARKYAEEYEASNKKKDERIRNLETFIADIIQALKDNGLIDLI